MEKRYADFALIDICKEAQKKSVVTYKKKEKMEALARANPLFCRSKYYQKCSDTI